MDIVIWLRKEAELVALPRLAEAADEIERLRGETESWKALVEDLERLRERCEGYKGQVWTGSREIERLRDLLAWNGINPDAIIESAKGESERLRAALALKPR